MRRPTRIWRGFFLTAVFGLTVASRLEAQRGAPNTPSQIATRLNSPDLLTRSKAFAELSEADFGTNAVRQLLPDLLQRENRMVDSINALGDGASSRLGEGYVEYLSEVVGACFRHCDRKNPRALKALATTAYNYDSQLATTLAKDHGPEVTSILLERARSKVSIIRQDAVMILGTMYEKGRGLSADQKKRIHSLAVSLAADTSVGARIAGVSVLGRVGNRNDLPLLRRVSRQDLVTTVGRTGPNYPVRMAADSAIARIERRPPD